MKEIKNTEPFPYSYRAYNRLTSCYSDAFSNVKDLLDSNFIENFTANVYKSRKRFRNWDIFTTSLKKKYIYYPVISSLLNYIDRWRLEDKARRDNKENVYVIIEIESNRILEIEEIKEKYNFQYYSYLEYYAARNEYYERMAQRLIRYKNNSLKIKKNYAAGQTSYSEERPSYDPCFAMSYFAKIRTANERRILEGVKAEYDREYYGLVRGKRSLLPTAWDDKKISARYTYKSWKHNSKRRKQWMPK